MPSVVHAVQHGNVELARLLAHDVDVNACYHDLSWSCYTMAWDVRDPIRFSCERAAQLAMELYQMVTTGLRHMNKI
jgi:hypothetical protein